MFFSLVFCAELEEAYEGPDFVGRVIRQFLVPPTSYQEVIKKYRTHKNIQVRLGPRVCLRKLAKKQVVGYTFFMHLYFVLLFWMGPRDYVAVVGMLCVRRCICLGFLRDLERIWRPCFY
jgi:hypothetical protein